MPLEDAERWNKRYQSYTGLNTKAPVSFLVENLNLLPQYGLAMDIAMGSGRNSGVLINHGLSVVGIDISLQAALNAKKKYPKLIAVVADLTNFAIPSSIKFDVILNFYYLQRTLIKELHRYINPFGFLIIETLTAKMKIYQPDTPDDYLLQENELPGLLGDHWRIIKFREGWSASQTGKQKSVASLIAQYFP